MSTRAETADGRWSVPVTPLLLAALTPFVVLALWQLRWPLDLSIGDQAQYLIHARSILTGRGYTDDGYIYYPYVPIYPYPRIAISPAAYPPGLPLLIALVQALGGSLFVVRLVMIGLAATFLYVAGRYLAELEDRWLAAGTVLVCGLVPQLALFASGLYSDFVFAALVWGLCLVLDRPGAWTVRRAVVATLLGIAALAVRTAGIALVPALVVHLAWRRGRHRESWTLGLVPLVSWVVAYLVLDRMYPSTAGYADQIATATTGGSSTVAVIARLAVNHLLAYRDAVSGFHFTPFPWRLANVLYHVLALLLGLIGAIVWLRRAGVRFLMCFVVFYVAMLMLLPWPLARMLWPLLPVLWFATLQGLVFVLGLIGLRRVAIPAALAAAAAIAVLAVSIGNTPPRIVGIGDLPQGRALYEFVQQEARRAPMRVAFSNPRDIARLDGVAGMSVPNLRSDSLFAELEAYRISHAVIGSMGMGRYGDRVLRSAVRERPERFERLFANDSFALYRLLPPTGRSASPAPPRPSPAPAPRSP